MTIPNTARKAGPLLGTGSQTAWPFTFKVFAAGDVQVTIANSSGVETLLVLGTDYSVTLNSNQETSPGGTVTYPISGSALPVGSVLAIIGDLDYDQPLDLPSGGNFSPTALENQLDRSTMQIQQLREEMNRTAKLPPTSSESVEALVDDLQRLADSADNLDTVADNIADITTVANDLNEPVSEINTVATSIANVNNVGNNISNVNTVAGISANVTTVAGIAANVTTVAGIAANVTAVAGNATNINAVAGNATNINAVNANKTNIDTVAGNNANVTTVAGISGNVTTVAGISADVQTVADNLADVTNFADVYLGPKASDPTLRNDGSALQIGDLYFNTATDALRAYSGSVWVAGTAGTLSVQNLSGNGSTTAFTLSAAPAGENNTQVYIGGVYQQKDQYSVSGTTLTFSSAPTTGTNNIEVVTISTLALGETDASLVSFLPAGTGAVERTAQDKMRDTVSVKDFGAKGDWNGTTGTDDYAFIQAAINYLFSVGGGELHFPKGFYRITQPLNLAGNATAGRFGNTPITFTGPGIPNAFDTGSWSTYGGAWIVGQTGDWIMDLTGMQYFKAEGLGFRGTGTGASNKGILSARSTVVSFAHCQQFNNCVIWVDSAPAATSVGSIGLANNGAETFLMEQCWVIADTPLTITWRNADDLALSSPYVTIQSAAPYNSTTMLNFRNTTFQAITGFASWIQGACDVFFDTCIWSSMPGNTTNQAIRFLSGQAGAAHCQDIRITGQIENYPGAVRVDDAQVWNIDINVMMPSPTSAYVSAGGVTMNNLVLNVHHTFGSTPQVCFNCSSAATLNGGEINVYAGGSLTANTNLITKGTLIRGHDFDTSGALGFTPGATYVALGSSGATIAPPLAQAIVPNGANNAVAATAPNVPSSYLRPDGFVQLAGSFTPNGATTIAAGVAAGTVVVAHRPNREVDGIVYVAGSIYYCRVLTSGQIYFGGNVTTGQLANIDGFSYKVNN